VSDTLVGAWEPANDAPDHRRRVVWAIPTVLAVLGTVNGAGDAHLMNCSWLTPVANEPSRLVVSLEVTSKTRANLRAVPSWTLSLLDRENRATGRAFVKPELSWENGDAELANGHAVARTAAGVPYLVAGAAALAGRSATQLADLGDHDLWLLTVDEIAGSPAFFSGPASQRAVPILGVHDTRMNYGR
jgi:flavin reductase (DIM6/NTAB) family NADH-FMN oxidoreductase RutF